MLSCLIALALLGGVGYAKSLPSSSPHSYPGMPKGDYGTNWQTYFKVPSSLPGMGFDLGESYAGNIAVQRPNHPNNTLFFWGFEARKGSLTAPVGRGDSEPWAIWLQGGPGTSSLSGLFNENGPARIVPGTNNFQKNGQAWSQLVDYFWIDQPVGAGFSTSDADAYAVDESQVADDFVGFLTNLVKVFPSLAKRPFYLTGESYAGRYIPNIAKALFSMANPPVKLTKLVMGNPALGSISEFKVLPMLSLLRTYPQIIGYDTDVYDYFADQAQLCGLNISLSYPQTGGNFPPIDLISGADKHLASAGYDSPCKTKKARRSVNFHEEVAARYSELRAKGAISPRQKRATFDFRAGEINPWYGCSIWNEVLDYAVNFTYPWSATEKFDTTNVPNALDPVPCSDPYVFLNGKPVRTALHAPTDKNWTLSFDYPWGSRPSGIDRSPVPMTFLTELAANATAHGVSVILYSGNDDTMSPHFGTEVSIQNTTFGGIQGFTRQPSTPWWDDDGNWAGIIHQERNWTYALFYGAGHEVIKDKPVAAYTFFREFVLGSNETGLVENIGPDTVVNGGENPTLQQIAIPGQLGIVFGSFTAEGTTRWPSATRAAFAKHVGQVAVTGTGSIAPSTPTADSRFGTSAKPWQPCPLATAVAGMVQV